MYFGILALRRYYHNKTVS